MDTREPSVDMGEDGANEAADGETPSHAAATDPVSGSGPTLEEIAAERDRLLEENKDLTDRLLRRQAEFDNFRRRAERERLNVIEFAHTDSVRAILPVLDDFERALKTETADKVYARGMELIYQRLSDELKKLGLEPIAAKGQKFDPHIHHAVEMVETDEAEDHTVLDEYQQGYNFRGRLLRPAMVKVAVTKK